MRSFRPTAQQRTLSEAQEAVLWAGNRRQARLHQELICSFFYRPQDTGYLDFGPGYYGALDQPLLSFAQLRQEYEVPADGP